MTSREVNNIHNKDGASRRNRRATITRGEKEEGKKPIQT